MRLKPGGIVQKYQLMASRLECPMHLKDYPADSQKCIIQAFSPFGIQTDIIKDWLTYSDVYDPEEGPFITSITNTTYTNKDGTVTVLTISFERKVGPFIYGSILPALMCVSIAFGQFWLTVMPARAAIAIISYLTLNNLGAQVQSNLPQTGETTW